VDLICAGKWYETLRIDGQTVMAEIRMVSAEEAADLQDRAEYERRYRSGGRGRIYVDCTSIMGAGFRECIGERIAARRYAQRESEMCRNPRYRTSESCRIYRDGR
jgi:hypothetical protein